MVDENKDAAPREKLEALFRATQYTSHSGQTEVEEAESAKDAQHVVMYSQVMAAADAYAQEAELRGHVGACGHEGYDIVNRKAVACGDGSYYCPDAPARCTEGS